MTIAELHGKLSSDVSGELHDRMEDLLTSDVFGTMQYAGWNWGFLDWVLSAEQPRGVCAEPQPLNAVLPASQIKSIHYAFWPWLPNHREPDLALLVELEEGRAILLIVEAKYLSGMSDFAISGEIDEFGRTGNQIVDQIQGIAALSSDQIAGWFSLREAPLVERRVHLLVTSHTLFPTTEYKVACTCLPPPWPISAYWLSWTSLARYLTLHEHHPDPGRAAMIHDLIRLLRRKGLVPYRGFEQKPWTAHGGPSFWSDRWWRLAPAPLGSSSFWRDDYWKETLLELPAYRPFWEGSRGRTG